MRSGWPPWANRRRARLGPTTAGSAPLVAEVGHDPDGRLLLRVAGLTLRLEAALDVPVGARLQVALPDGFAARFRAAAFGEDADRKLIGALWQPSARGDPVGPRLPAADHTLAARLLRWIATLRASAAPPDAPDNAWGGPDSGPETDLRRSALSELGQLARTPQPSGWRVVMMPFGVEDPSALRLYLRDLPPDGEGGARPGRARRQASQRAIFEVELSELGRCQLDLLCQARLYELAVRTERPLAPALQDAVRDLLKAACALAGVVGKVDFRAAELLVLPDPLAPAGNAWIA